MRWATPVWVARKLLASVRFPDRAMARLDHNEVRHNALHDKVAELRAQVGGLHAELVASRTEQSKLGAALADLSDRAADSVATSTALAQLSLQLESTARPTPPADGPLVTVIVATRDRAATLPAALASIRAQTYPRWECIVVDDGGEDESGVLVDGLARDDPRFRCVRIAASGAAAARNRGLELAEGTLVAYLDSDNEWLPSHLARAVQALADAPEAAWVVSGQVVVDGLGRAHVRPDLHPSESVRRANFVDLNALVHRTTVLSEVGRFDESLARLSDWDLVARLAQRSEPARVRVTTGLYSTGRPDRITNRVPFAQFAHTIRGRYRGAPAAGLRVLLAEWHYPQVTETYIDAVATALSRLGADVQVWSQDDVAVVANTTTRVRRGELGAALDDIQPDLVITHWQHKGEELRPETRARGIPHVVRTHGFEHDPSVVTRLLQDPGVLLHTFAHLQVPVPSGGDRQVVSPTCFDDERYRPTTDKDPRLVARTAAGLLTKDLETFLLAASLCPDHRFVLILGHSLLVEHRTEQLIARAAELGSPCEIRIDLQHDEVAEIISEAGIYLHTHGTDHPVSMPISIAEAMATGAWVLARDLPGLSQYVGVGGTMYGGTTVEERATAAAQLIRGSAEWSKDAWRQRWTTSSDHAYSHYANTDVVEDMLHAWHQAFPLRIGRGAG